MLKNIIVKKYAFSLLKNFVVQKSTNFIVKKFHCKKIYQKMLLKNFIVKKIRKNTKYYTKSCIKGWRSGIAGAFDWIYG